MKAFCGYQLAHVDATQIALRNELGTRTQPIINTAIIGAFARIMNEPSMDIISKAITEEIEIHPEKNIQASREAFEAVTIYGAVE